MILEEAPLGRINIGDEPRFFSGNIIFRTQVEDSDRALWMRGGEMVMFNSWYHDNYRFDPNTGNRLKWGHGNLIEDNTFSSSSSYDLNRFENHKQQIQQVGTQNRLRGHIIHLLKLEWQMQQQQS